MGAHKANIPACAYNQTLKEMIMILGESALAADTARTRSNQGPSDISLSP